MATQKRDFGATQPPDPFTQTRRSVSIEDMIAQENDPKQRSFLIVLNSINSALVANTATVKEIKESLDEHLEEYAVQTRNDAQLKDQGRGAWKILAWVLGCVQAALLTGGAALVADLREIHQAVTLLHQIDAKLDNRVVNLERKP